MLLPSATALAGALLLDAMVPIASAVSCLAVCIVLTATSALRLVLVLATVCSAWFRVAGSVAARGGCAS